jgi:hypothetical protein
MMFRRGGLVVRCAPFSVVEEDEATILLRGLAEAELEAGAAR